MNIPTSIGRRITAYVAEHPRISTALAIGIPVLAAGAFVAARTGTGSGHPGPEAAATGAQLLTPETFTPHGHIQPVFRQYDVNDDGRIELRSESGRQELYIDVWCEDKQGKRQRPGIFRRSCDVPRSRGLLVTHTIGNFLVEADRDHNLRVGRGEIDRMLRRYDTHDAYGKPGRDGTLQQSEYDAFVSDWGEHVSHSQILGP